MYNISNRKLKVLTIHELALVTGASCYCSNTVGDQKQNDDKNCKTYCCDRMKATGWLNHNPVWVIIVASKRCIQMDPYFICPISESNTQNSSSTSNSFGSAVWTTYGSAGTFASSSGSSNN